MFSSIANLASDIWNLFNTPSYTKTDDDILQECITAFENESSSIKNDDFEDINIHDMCSKCTGKITELTDTYGVLDNKIKFSLHLANNFKIKLNDLICYMAIREENSIKFVKILSVFDSWDANENEHSLILESEVEENFNIVDRVIIGKVIGRENRFIIVDKKDKNLKINLNEVSANFIPIPGDWIEVYCRVQQNNVLMGNDVGEVLEVQKICSLRSKVVDGKISHWNEEKGWGVVNNDIIFTSSVCNIKYSLKVGDTVIVEAIESDQQQWAWRALSLHVMFSIRKGVKKVRKIKHNDNMNGIVIDEDPDFGDMKLNTKPEIKVKITNTSNKVHFFMNVRHCTNKENAQIEYVKEGEIVTISPGEVAYALFKCEPRFYGRTKELVYFSFIGFDIKREIFLNVVDDLVVDKFSSVGTNIQPKKTLHILETMKNHNSNKFIPGIRPSKPPPFIKIRIPPYQIPSNVMSVFKESIKLSKKSSEELMFFQEKLKFAPTMNIDNYTEWFHNLLYIEEIQNIVRYKMYDMDKAWMTKESEFLRLTIEGLADRRPILLVGDSVKISNPWGDSSKSPMYEGFIHKVLPDGILLRFSCDFHKKYNGEDVSVSFSFSRSSFQKCHFAIDLACTHLGSQVLFPEKLILNKEQVIFDPSQFADDDLILKDITKKEYDKIDVCKKSNIRWVNPKLNHIQKKAVVNILMGVARPLPYIIFGPPGTGKTMTLIEAIIQITCLLPNSRILVATPSNSAANLLTERLIASGRFNPGSLIRLLSMTHVLSGKLADNLKPYCATVNVSLEKSNKSKYHIAADGLRFECNKNYIGRHRITIGTCVCLGALIRMGFTSGHFTHIIVDEAGQATEPEIMVPLTLTDKMNGQIILAGDPMQLGPVVLSHVAKNLGLVDSYLERLLNTFPYQRDLIGHGSENCGYDPRLVTKLKYNYRSLQSIIKFSSNTFYNSEIISEVTTENEEVNDFVCRLSEIFSVEPNQYCGMYFHGIRGTNVRKNGDPSWYNPQEASTALMYLCKLYKHNFTADDIAIITPYIQQVRCIRMLIRNMGGIEEPKIATVEELQGQERKIIILSIVRSIDAHINDAEKYLGFIAQPKRVNVAFTRAQYLLIILGNPHVLHIDAMWRDALKYIISNNNYIGCDLPPEI